MSRANEPAYPEHNTYTDPRENEVRTDVRGGMTIREHLAAMAMQGLCANAPATKAGSANGLAKTAIEIADALLSELSKGSAT